MMAYDTIFCLLLVNFAASVLMAYSVGKAWAETEHCGGWRNWGAWAGAAVSAAGFTWCYLIVLILFVEDASVKKYLLSIALFLGFPVTTANFVTVAPTILLANWAYGYRQHVIGGDTAGRKQSSAPAQASGEGLSGGDWLPVPVGSGTSDSGSGGGDSDPGDLGNVIALLALLLFALCGGILTTAFIIRRVANEPLPVVRPLPPLPKDADPNRMRIL